MIPERLPAHTRNPRKLVNAVRASSRDNGDKIRTQFKYAPENYTLTRESLRAIMRTYKQIDFYTNRINRDPHKRILEAAFWEIVQSTWAQFAIYTKVFQKKFDFRIYIARELPRGTKGSEEDSRKLYHLHHPPYIVRIRCTMKTV